MCSYLQLTKCLVLSLYTFNCRIAVHRATVGYGYRIHAQSNDSNQSIVHGSMTKCQMHVTI